MNQENVSFQCPKCGKEFSLNELINHNAEAFNELINAKVEDKILERSKEVEKDLKNGFVKEQQILKQELEATHLDNVNQLKNSYEQKINQLNLDKEKSFVKLQELEKNQSTLIESNKLTIKNDFVNEINVLNSTISELKNELKLQTEKQKTETEKIHNSLINTYNSEKEALEAAHLDKINKLKTDYDQKINQLILDKEKSFVKLQEQEKNQNTLIESNKLTIKNEFINEINTLNSQISELKNELKLQVEKQKTETEKIQNSLAEVYNSEKEVLEKTYRDQIEELKIKNAENRILQSKTKGENWEIEVENELHKAFDIIDKIEKITKSIDDKKADYLQTVRNNNRQELGKIVYEAKNAKWSEAWLPKLSVDIANNKAKYGILVTSSFHDKYQIDTGFKQSDDYENIWIADPYSFIFVAQIIRKLIEVEYNFNWKEMKLVGSSDDKLFKEYQDKINNVKDYMKYNLPVFIKTFNTQINDIVGVKNSLIKNADKLNKTAEILERRFDKQIKKQLEKITGESIAELEDSQLATENLDQSITNFSN